MDPISYVFGWIAAVLVGLSKTGLPGVSIPAVVLMTEAFPEDTDLAIGAMLPVLLLGDVLAVARYRHHAQWSRLWRLFPYVAVGMAPGWLLLRQLSDGDALRPVLGGLMLGLLMLEVARRRYDWQHVPHKWWFIGGMGLLTGFSTTVAHAAFPVMTVYLLSQGMAKREFVGTAAWFFLLVNLSKLPLYASNRMIPLETLRFDLLVAPATLLGVALGIYVLKRIPQHLFDTLALVLAAIAAARLLLS